MEPTVNFVSGHAPAGLHAHSACGASLVVCSESPSRHRLLLWLRVDRQSSPGSTGRLRYSRA